MMIIWGHTQAKIFQHILFSFILLSSLKTNNVAIEAEYLKQNDNQIEIMKNWEPAAAVNEDKEKAWLSQAEFCPMKIWILWKYAHKVMPVYISP